MFESLKNRLLEMKAWSGVIICILLQFNYYSWAQVVGKFSVDDGLAQSFVSAVLQDKDGFIWAGTQNGLSRYDGSRFKNFRTNVSATSLSSNKIKALLNGPESTLWAVNGNTIQIYNNLAGGFTTPDYFNTNALKNFREAAFDDAGNLWILQAEALLNLKVEKENGKWDLHPICSIPILNNAPRNPVTLAIDGDDVFLGGANGVWRFDANPKSFVHEIRIATDPVTQIWEDEVFGGIWIRTKDRIGYWKSKQIKWFPQVKSGSNLKTFHTTAQTRTIVVGKNNVFAWNGNRLDTIVTRLPFEIISGWVDFQGSLWVGTNASGLCQINLTERKIKILEAGVVITEPTFKNAGGMVWGLREKGCKPVFTWQKGDGNKAAITAPVLKTAIDHTGTDWYLTCDYVLKNRSGTSIPLSNYFQAGETLLRMFFLPDNSVVLAKGNGLLFVNINTRQTIFLPHNLITGNPDPLRINSIRAGANGAVWMGMDSGLLVIYPDWSTGKCSTQIYQRGKELPDEEVLAMEILPGQERSIWLGTSAGLWLCETELMRYKPVVTKNIKPDEVIYCMQRDATGKIWLGTNDGLKVYNPADQTSAAYTKKDGLPANEFNRGTESISQNGEIFMGTVGGIIRFYPGELSTVVAAANIAVTDILLNDTTYINLINPGQIDCWEGDRLAFQFASLHYSGNRQTTYQYRMIGLSDNWAASENNTVTYAQLNPGNYRFEVRSADASNAPVQINVVVKRVGRRKGVLGLTIMMFLLLLGGGYYFYGCQKKKGSSPKPEFLTMLPTPAAVTMEDAPTEPAPTEESLVAENAQYELKEMVEEIIEANFRNSEFNVIHLQEKLKISKVHLHRKMIAATGKTAAYFLKQRRLAEAENLLKSHPEMTIAEVAYSAGFNDPNYFSTVFSATFGVSPKKFREKQS